MLWTAASGRGPQTLPCAHLGFDGQVQPGDLWPWSCGADVLVGLVEGTRLFSVGQVWQEVKEKGSLRRAAAVTKHMDPQQGVTERN